MTLTQRQTAALEALPPKQRVFVKEYVIDRNATRAAIAASYSAATASQAGARLLTNVKVCEAISAFEEKQDLDRAQRAARQLGLWEEGVFADLADLYNRETGELKPVWDWPLIFRTLIAVEVETEEIFGAEHVTDENGKKKRSRSSSVASFA